MPAATLSVVAETPEPDQGETAEKPIPAPNASSMSDKAAITTAPAATAPQETPVSDFSAETLSLKVVCDMGTATSPADMIAIICQDQIPEPRQGSRSLRAAYLLSLAGYRPSPTTVRTGRGEGEGFSFGSSAFVAAWTQAFTASRSELAW